MAFPKDSSKSTGIRNSYGEYVENSYNPVTERQIGKGPEETLHQKNIYKRSIRKWKVAIIGTHQGNAKQNYKHTPLHTREDGWNKKKKLLVRRWRNQNLPAWLVGM